MTETGRPGPLGGGAHVPAHIRQRLGDARGRWEGDTLVVDTTNFSSLTSFQGAGARAWDARGLAPRAGR